MQPSFLNYVNNRISARIGQFTPEAPKVEKDVARDPTSLKVKAARAILSDFQANAARFEQLPIDLKEAVLGQCNFNQWLEIRRRATPQTVRALDIELLRKNHLDHLFIRFPGANNDAKLFSHFFTQFVANASKAELEEMIRLDGADQFRPKTYVLSRWEKAATIIRNIISHPAVLFPAAVVIGVYSFKGALKCRRVYQEFLLPLAIAAAEKYLNRKVWMSIKLVNDYRSGIYFTGVTVDLISMRLPQRVQPYVRPIGKVFMLPVNIATKIFWLPISAALYAYSYSYTGSAKLSQAIDASVQASEVIRLREGVERARTRWIQDVSSLRAQPAAAAA